MAKRKSITFKGAAADAFVRAAPKALEPEHAFKQWHINKTARFEVERTLTLKPVTAEQLADWCFVSASHDQDMEGAAVKISMGKCAMALHLLHGGQP